VGYNKVGHNIVGNNWRDTILWEWDTIMWEIICGIL
jgi:hypothetical protein